MSVTRQDAARALAAVAASGTDPDHLLSVVGWALRPRHGLDGLRRTIRDAPEPPDLPPGAAVAAAAGPPPGHLLHEAVGLGRTWRGLGVRAALVGDPAYPSRLADGWPHADGPTLLLWRGATPDDASAVAVVGARRATGYGLGIAAWLSEAAARAGARVVSGGAAGVDAAAHEAALEEPGGTTVVLGCGHAVAYPRDHARSGGLFDRVLDHGGSLVSELLPHHRVQAWTVRARNRIVAGLADVTVVVEGRERSGALLTATAAAERGRTVLAVPGDVRAAGSAAPHRLLGEGADPCTGPGDLLAALGAPASAAMTAPAEADAAGIAGLPDAVAQVLVASWPRPIRADDLAARSSLPTGRLLAALTRARAAGVVAESAEGVRLRRPPGRG